MRFQPVIVTDYNGHIRIKQLDLDMLYTLERREGEYLYTIKELRNKVAEIESACDNLIKTNSDLSREISELRWAIKDAEQKIERLQRLDVEVITV